MSNLVDWSQAHKNYLMKLQTDKTMAMKSLRQAGNVSPIQIHSEETQVTSYRQKDPKKLSYSKQRTFKRNQIYMNIKSSHANTFYDKNMNQTGKQCMSTQMESEQMRRSVIYDTTKKDHHFVSTNFNSKIQSPHTNSRVLNQIELVSNKNSDDLEVTQLHSFNSTVRDGNAKIKKQGSPFKNGYQSGSALGSVASGMQMPKESFLSLKEQVSSQILRKTKTIHRNQRYSSTGGRFQNGRSANCSPGLEPLQTHQGHIASNNFIQNQGRQSVGYLVKPTFQHFDWKHRKYPSFQKPFGADNQLPQFFKNKLNKDLETQEFKLNSSCTLIQGNPICQKAMNMSEMPKISKSFEFTKKNKIGIICQYLGQEESSKIRQPNDIQKQIKSRLDKDMVKYEQIIKKQQNERIKDKLGNEIQKLIHSKKSMAVEGESQQVGLPTQDNSLTQNFRVDGNVELGARSSSEVEIRKKKVGQALFLIKKDGHEIETPSQLQKIMYEKCKYKIELQNLLNEFGKVQIEEGEEEDKNVNISLQKLTEKELKLQNLRDMNYQKSIAKVLSYTHGPKKKAETFSEDKLHILYKASEFIKNVTVPKHTHPKEQLRWLRQYLGDQKRIKAEENYFLMRNYGHLNQNLSSQKTMVSYNSTEQPQAPLNENFNSQPEIRIDDTVHQALVNGGDGSNTQHGLQRRESQNENSQMSLSKMFQIDNQAHVGGNGSKFRDPELLSRPRNVLQYDKDIQLKNTGENSFQRQEGRVNWDGAPFRSQDQTGNNSQTGEQNYQCGDAEHSEDPDIY